MQRNQINTLRNEESYSTDDCLVLECCLCLTLDAAVETFKRLSREVEFADRKKKAPKPTERVHSTVAINLTPPTHRHLQLLYFYLSNPLLLLSGMPVNIKQFLTHPSHPARHSLLSFRRDVLQLHRSLPASTALCSIPRVFRFSNEGKYVLFVSCSADTSAPFISHFYTFAVFIGSQN